MLCQEYVLKVELNYCSTHCLRGLILSTIFGIISLFKITKVSATGIRRCVLGDTED